MVTSSKLGSGCNHFLHNHSCLIVKVMRFWFSLLNRTNLRSYFAFRVHAQNSCDTNIRKIHFQVNWVPHGPMKKACTHITHAQPITMPLQAGQLHVIAFSSPLSVHRQLGEGDAGQPGLDPQVVHHPLLWHQPLHDEQSPRLPAASLRPPSRHWFQPLWFGRQLFYTLPGAEGERGCACVREREWWWKDKTEI